MTSSSQAAEVIIEISKLGRRFWACRRSSVAYLGLQMPRRRCLIEYDGCPDEISGFSVFTDNIVVGRGGFELFRRNFCRQKGSAVGFVVNSDKYSPVETNWVSEIFFSGLGIFGIRVFGGFLSWRLDKG